MKFLSDIRGNVLMLTGLSILFLFAIAGAGVDFGRQQLVHMKLQNASDASAIAAASLPDSVTTDQRRAVALRYYNLNFPTEYLGIARPTPNIAITGTQVTVDASTSFNANFVSNVGVTSLEAQGKTVVNRTAGQATIYDVIMVMDNSNSMAYPTSAPSFAASSDQNNARNAAILQCKPDMQKLFTYSWCPYYVPRNAGIPMPDGSTRTYNSVSCSATGWNDWCNLLLYGADTSTTITGVAVDNSSTRLGALRTVALNFVSSLLDSGTPGSRLATVTWAGTVYGSQALTTDGATIRNRINGMFAWGGTNPFAAMQQANTLASGFDASHVKAVVLLSDGRPTQTGSFLPPNLKDASGCDGSAYCAAAVSNTLPICTQMKNAGVQIYTIGFLSPTDPDMNNTDRANARAFLQACASVDANNQPRYYEAPTGADLDQAFSQVLGALGKIKITQ